MKTWLYTLAALCASACGFALPCENTDLPLWVTPQTHAQPLTQAIERAKQSVQVITYTLTDRQIIRALIQAKHHGANIQVLLDKAPYNATNTNQKAIRWLREEHIAVKTAPQYFTNLHEKALIIDKKTAFLMTGNFTYSGFYTQRNLYLKLTKPALVGQIETVFQADWSERTPTLSASPLVFSPENHGRDILRLIDSSQHSLKLYAPGFGDPAFIRALKHAAKRGVRITLLTRPKQSTGYRVMIRSLKDEGITVLPLQTPTLHAKLIISDDRIAYLGSNNFTSTSFHHNRELGILVCNQNLITRLNQQFDSDSGVKAK